MISEAKTLRLTPLHDLHVELGAKMVPFAGYDMPVQYPTGILTEHLHTREGAGLFDVSHMGQVRIWGDDYRSAAGSLERLCPADFLDLKPTRQRYSFFTNGDGGILDDLMVTRVVDSKHGDHLFMVVNAGCKEEDVSHLRANLNNRCEILELTDRALLALQGPKAAMVMARLAPESSAMVFMSGRELAIGGIACFATRSGYTGEDGFEISVPAGDAHGLAKLLLAQPEVKPIGLGARDSLRLEAGLCLYGNDLTPQTTPVEAGLVWAIGKRRREQGGFPGAGIVQRQIAGGPSRRRVGLMPEGRAPARSHTVIANATGEPVGEVTSGGFAPSIARPIAMGYVRAEFSREGTSVQLIVRDKALPATVVAMPFVAHNYHRGS